MKGQNTSIEICRFAVQKGVALILTLVRFPGFATFARGGQGGTLPACLETKRRRFKWEKNGGCSRRVLAIGYVCVCVFLILGQQLTQLWRVKGQMFAKSAIFQLHKSMPQKSLTIMKGNFCKRVSRSFLDRTTGCLMFWYLDWIFLMYRSPGRNSVTLTGKITRGRFSFLIFYLKIVSFTYIWLY